jgi:hypothetical protein
LILNPTIPSQSGCIKTLRLVFIWNHIRNPILSAQKYIRAK